MSAPIDFPWGEALQNGSPYTIIMVLLYILSAVVAGLLGVLTLLVKGLDKVTRALADNAAAIGLLEKQCSNTQADVKDSLRDERARTRREAQR
jgi:hypothetical protein